MNQWIEKKDGQYYWYQQFPKNEMKLLKRYHVVMGKMTKLDYSRIIK